MQPGNAYNPKTAGPAGVSGFMQVPRARRRRSIRPERHSIRPERHSARPNATQSAPSATRSAPCAGEPRDRAGPLPPAGDLYVATAAPASPAAARSAAALSVRSQVKS